MCTLSCGIFTDHWYCELYGYTKEEIILFATISYTIYIECIVQPTSASGGVSATSICQTATQIKLKTLQFAGVGSMNITQGVAPNIKTLVMACQLEINDDEEIARIIKSHIDIIYLSQICNYIECHKFKGYRILILYIRIAIKDYNLIQQCGDKIVSQIFDIILTYLMNNLENTQINRIKNVSRASIHQNKICNHYLEPNNTIETTKKLIKNILNTNECPANSAAIDRQWRILNEKHCCNELVIAVFVKNGMWFIYLDSIQIYL